MSKTLSTIQTVFKVLKILCKVVFILCLVGGIGCAVGLLILSIVPLAPLDIEEIIAEEADMSVASLCITCIAGIVVCASEAVVFKFSEIYFTHELEAGTPFTYEGSKEIFRLGIISLAVPFGASVFSGILLGIAQLVSVNVSDINVNYNLSIGRGLVLIFASVIFKYGAELIQKDKKSEEEQNS